MIMQKIRWAILASALTVTACSSAVSGSGDSITRLEHARSTDPASEAAVRNLGIAYYKASPPRYAEAREALRQAVTMNPSDGVAALYLGLAAEAQNDLPSAKSAYETYLAVGKTRGVKNQIQQRLAFIARKEIEASAKQAIAQEQTLSSTVGPRTTVAVMPFTFAGGDSLKPLERGLAELLVTDLSRSRELKVVERERLQALLDEIQLQQSTNVAGGTGVRAGKILQAGSLVGGRLSQIGANQINANATVTSVQTAQTIGTGFNGQTNLDQIFNAEKSIALQIFSDLGVTLTTAERNEIEQRPTRSLQAFLAYSRGLELDDRGQYDAAGRSFDNAVRIDPGFGAAQQKSREVQNVVSGNTVTSGTVEAGLRGAAEGGLGTAATDGATASDPPAPPTRPQRRD